DAFPKGAQLIDASFGRVASKGGAFKRKTSIPCGRFRSDVNIHGILPSHLSAPAASQGARKAVRRFGDDVRCLSHGLFLPWATVGLQNHPYRLFNDVLVGDG